MKTEHSNNIVSLKNQYVLTVVEFLKFKRIYDNQINIKKEIDRNILFNRTKRNNWYDFEKMYWHLLMQCHEVSKTLKGYDTAFKENYNIQKLNDEINEAKKHWKYIYQYKQRFVTRQQKMINQIC